MLVLTRRPDAGDQSIIKIGDDIEITVVSTRGGEVRLGVSAPRQVPVHREEVHAEIAIINAATVATARLLSED